MRYQLTGCKTFFSRVIRMKFLSPAALALLTLVSCFRNDNLMDPSGLAWFESEPRFTASHSIALEYGMTLSGDAWLYYVTVPRGAAVPTALEVQNGRAAGGAAPLAAARVRKSVSDTASGAVVPSTNTDFDVYVIAVPVSAREGISSAVKKIQGRSANEPAVHAVWGSPGTGAGQFSFPYGVAADSSGNLFVTDTSNHRVQKFSASGRFLSAFGSFGSDPGQMNGPAGIAIDGNDSLYVCDRGNNRVQKFSPGGEFLLQWGSAGSGTGQFNWPAGIAVQSSGRIAVADWGNHRIQVFTPDGVFVRSWGSNGIGNGEFANPQGVAVDRDGNVFVTELFNDRVQKFDSEGNYLAQWGGFGGETNQFSDPWGVATDASGNVYVTSETYYLRIQKFTPGGLFLQQWGAGGTNVGEFAYPHGITVSAEGLIFLADSSNHRIQVFR